MMCSNLKLCAEENMRSGPEGVKTGLNLGQLEGGVALGDTPALIGPVLKKTRVVSHSCDVFSLRHPN